MNLFSQIEGRIIVAAFASNVYRVQQIIEASIASGRKVVVFGHSMEKTIEIASKLKYITYPKGWVLNSRELKSKIPILLQSFVQVSRRADGRLVTNCEWNP